MSGERRLTSIKQLVNDMIFNTSTTITNVPLHVQNDPIPVTVNTSYTSVSTSSVTILSANSSRKLVYIQNLSDSKDPVFINFKTPATIGGGVSLVGGESYAFPENYTYTGEVTAISANVNVKIIVATEGS